MEKKKKEKKEKKEMNGEEKIMEKNMKKKVVLKRDPIEKDGKTYYSYYVEGKVRAVDVRVFISVPDFGGYKALDIVFGGANEADLVVENIEMTNERGKKTIYKKYMAKSVDEDGVVYECKIKPYRASDTDLLNMIMG